jgi:hypothetical protein
MSELPHQWDEYVRLQGQLGNRRHVDGSSWGLEAELDNLLKSIGSEKHIPSAEELDRTARSESRKERHRATLRRVYLTPIDPTSDTQGRLDARHELKAVQDQVAAKDWELLHAIGVGRDYEELAEARGVTVGSLRVRVLRLRRGLTLRQRDSASDTSELGTGLMMAA